MLRGEILLVDFDPVRGSEADKRRPAVIVSNDGEQMRAVTVDRVTKRVSPFPRC